MILCQYLPSMTEVMLDSLTEANSIHGLIPALNTVELRELLGDFR